MIPRLLVLLSLLGLVTMDQVSTTEMPTIRIDSPTE